MIKYIALLSDLAWSKVVGVGIALAVAYFFLGYDSGDSLTEQIKAANAHFEESKRQLGQTKKAMEDAVRFEKEVMATNKQFERIIEYLPTKFGAAELTDIVNQRAGLAGVRVAKIEPKSPDTKAAFYEATRVSMTIEGKYEQILKFLSILSQVPKLLTFEQIEISQNKAGGGLTFQALLVGYRYLKDAPYIEPAGAPKPPAPGAAPAPGAPPPAAAPGVAK